MGKTHFGGQLYGRLNTEQFSFKLSKSPQDLTLFKEIWEKLNQGLEGKHTDTKLHDTINLPIEASDGTAINLIYPDYGGEQIQVMFEQRQINATWQNQIKNSDNWFLFIRLDLMENISDISTKFYKRIKAEENVPDPPPENIRTLRKDSAAFYVELLQTFLKIKGVALTDNIKPKLTILLSCWDKSKFSKNTIPMAALQQKMPLFTNFLQAIWPEKQLSIIGLSSLGQDLDAKKPDKKFAAKGPEDFGYLLLEDGTKTADITLTLKTLVT